MRVHKQSNIICVFMLTLLTCGIIIFHIPCSQANSKPNLYVDPAFTMVDVGESFSVNASIANVADLGGWELKLYYRNNILAIVTAIEGPFLKQGGTTAFFTVELNNNYNATHGRIWLTCVLIGSVPGVDGSGTLATTNFQTVGGGNTTLHLADTVLGDSQANPIDHTTNDGNVRVIGTADIAITNVTPCKIIVGQSYPMKTNVTIENQGDLTETFNVTAYANTTVIETKEITLPSGNSTTIAFTWNTLGFTKGNYTISAEADPLPSETDTADNIAEAADTVLVTVPGDVSGDHICDMLDIDRLIDKFMTTPSNPRWDPNCDINNDNSVDMLDISIAIDHFMEQW